MFSTSSGNTITNTEIDLTVATVCRNSLSLLPRCIESVRKLKGVDISYEHLLIDGASTDGTTEFLSEELKQGRISRLISEPDKGLYDAMNKAILNARGKVIVFINSDDEICADSVVDCCEPILAGKCQYTIAKALFITGKGNKVLSPNMQRIMWRQPYCHQSMYCATELLRKTGGFNGTKFPIGADTELMRRLYLQEVPYKIIPRIASHFYAGGVSNSLATYCEVYELMFHFQEYYRNEIMKRPATIHAIFKHLRRYSVKRAITTSKEQDSPIERERITHFIRAVIPPSFSPFRRLLLQTQLVFQTYWYAFLSKCCTKRKKKEIHLLSYQLTQLFREHI